MKKFKLLILSSFIYAHCNANKEEPQFSLFSNLPTDIQKEIVQKLNIPSFIDNQGATPEKVFEKLDSVRLLNKSFRSLLDDSIKKIGKAENPPDNNYTYLKFKQDTIKELVDKWKDKIVFQSKDPNYTIEKEIKSIIDLEAYIYLWHRTKNNRIFKDERDGIISRFAYWGLSPDKQAEVTRKLLEMGADFARNSTIEMTNKLINVDAGLLVAIEKQYLPVLKLILEASPKLNIDKLRTYKGNTLLVEAVKTGSSEIVEIILSRTKNQQYISQALDFAKKQLSNAIYYKDKAAWTAWKATGYMSSKFDDPDIKKWSDIVKILSAAKK